MEIGSTTGHCLKAYIYPYRRNNLILYIAGIDRTIMAVARGNLDPLATFLRF
jgi:hypothetical protein